MLPIFVWEYRYKLASWRYFFPVMDGTKNNGPGHIIAAREMSIQREHKVCAGGLTLVRLISPGTKTRLLVFVPTASRLWVPIAATPSRKEGGNMASAEMPPAPRDAVLTLTPVGSRAASVRDVPLEVERGDNTLLSGSDAPGGKPSAGGKKRPTHLVRRRRASDTDGVPACALSLEQQDYWLRLGDRKRQFAAFIAQHADILAPSNAHNASPGEVQKENEPQTPAQKQRAMLAEREPWLHVHGLSQEGGEHRDERNQHYVIKLLNKKSAHHLPGKQFLDKLDVSVELSVTFIVGEPPDLQYYVANRKEVSLRQVLTGDVLRDMKRQRVAADRKVRIEKLLLTDPHGVLDAHFLQIMAEKAKEAFIFDLHPELQAQLQEVIDSSEIENAYYTMAKNRLACALLPLLGEREHNAVAGLAQKWMDNQLTEQLVTLHQGGKHIQVPEMVALIEASGGMLISLSNGRIYLWTPDDTSAALRAFIHGHLSLGQRQSLIGLPFAATVDPHTCRIVPPLSFSASQNIWQALKQLDHDKMAEHLHEYVQQQRQAYQQQHQIKEDPHHVAQQVLMYGGLALSVLALFFSGGSAVVCASFMLANLGIGAVSCGLYVHTALTADDLALKKHAWSNALLSLLFTALGGAADGYQVMRAAGSRGSQVLFNTYLSLHDALKAGQSRLSLASVAETFIKTDARGRAIILVESLIKEGKDNLRQFGFSSTEAMLRINQITGRINFHHYLSLRSLGQSRRFFRDLVVITGRQALKMVPRGYELAAFSHAGERAELMFISLGEGRFGGYQLAPLKGDQALENVWGTVRLDDF
ncbi:hypothetical protein [Candidatus Sodalis sp. SoCistrobi]|uniref:hypothetical protein n=1 Tax=Candidatus Sodalis sp. SoCistrobi TaxID=1922216 RepID=UPI000A5198DA|nr:hypothetical protein [Candidatus Sodalis sp. SoCistrobi]